MERINPEGLHRNPAYSQAVILPAGARTLLIGGQNAVDMEGNLVGKGDLGAQTTKAVDNLVKCLDAAGGKLEDLAKVTIYIVGDQDIRPGFGAWMARWGDRKDPPAVTGIRVAGLTHPDYLVEIEAIAVLR